MSVAETLAGLLRDGPEYELPDRDAIEHLRARVDDAVDAARSEWGLPADRPVIRLPKGRITTASRCGRQLAAADGDIPAHLALLGQAIDNEAALLVVRAKQAGDPWQNALDIWKADDDREKLAQLASLADAERDELADLVRSRTEGLVRAFGEFEAGWWPRAQDRVSVAVGGGHVILSGIFDLYLGGGHSGRPGVIIEVKSGSTWQGNNEDARLYALLAALRDGVCPAAVITVTARDAIALAEPMRPSLLENAVERVERVLDNVYEVASGSIPQPTPGPWCERCAVRRDCPASPA